MNKLLTKICLFNLLLIFSIDVFAQSDSVQIDLLKKVLLKQKGDSNKVNTLDSLSSILLSDNEYDSALYFATAAEKLSANLKFIPGLARANWNMGLCNSYKEDYKQAYVFLSKAIKFFQQIDDVHSIAKCYRFTEYVFQQQVNYTDALNNYYAAYTLAEKIKDSDKDSEC